MELGKGCSCGQTLTYNSERDYKLKIRMHSKFCPNPYVEAKDIMNRIPTYIYREIHYNMGEHKNGG